MKTIKTPKNKIVFLTFAKLICNKAYNLLDTLCLIFEADNFKFYPTGKDFSKKSYEI